MITVPALYECWWCGALTTSECGFCSKQCRVDDLLANPLVPLEPVRPAFYMVSGGRPSPVRRSPVRVTGEAVLDTI